MNRKVVLWLLAGLAVVAGIVLTLFLKANTVAVLEPRGSIADQQRDLLVFATLLMLVIIIPVYFMTFFFAWKYRASNKKARYQPEWDHSKLAESIWWGFPMLIIFILSIVTWVSTHTLDPFRPIDSKVAPLRIQVVALQWKWLFLYPEQGIASVNYLQIPEDTPINFEITADAPMNSFWVPQLGGQIYAMAGMNTKLHLIADEPGVFYGSSANISGAGFANMRFNVEAVDQLAFDAWAASVKNSSSVLDTTGYNELSRPGASTTGSTYVAEAEQLYELVMRKYVSPDHQIKGIKDTYEEYEGYTHNEAHGEHHE